MSWTDGPTCQPATRGSVILHGPTVLASCKQPGILLRLQMRRFTSSPLNFFAVGSV